MHDRGTITGPVLGEAVRLQPTFDADLLAAELTTVVAHRWNLQRVYAAGDVGQVAPVDWRVLPLRSLDGDPERTDPGGPGRLDFAETRWLDSLPYLRRILASIPAPLNAVRLMALGPGAHANPHRDPKYRLDRGLSRLHIPIRTLPEAVLVLDGVEHCWQPGTLWYGDFSREHLVRNSGVQTRIHVVIDCLLTHELAAWFPDEWQEALKTADVLFNRPAPQTQPDPGLVPEFLDIPEGFADFDRDDPLSGAPVRARFETAEGRLALDVAGHRFAMVPVASDEYRFTGWSEQRTIQFLGAEAALRHRTGRSETAVRLPAPAS